MDIVANCDFKHGKNAYTKGETYTGLEPEDGYYLIGIGWASKPGEQSEAPEGSDASLEIHNGAIGVGDSNG